MRRYVVSPEELKAWTIEGFERMFNQGDLSYADEAISPGGTDHQEAMGTEFIPHLKEVVTKLRAAFPDLHFEVHEALAGDDAVATRSTMTGTHLGRLGLGPLAALAPTGKQVAVPHMHFFHYQDGRLVDMWHVWDVPALMRQLGAAPPSGV
jgi:predicted ester cyclase